MIYLFIYLVVITLLYMLEYKHITNNYIEDRRKDYINAITFGYIVLFVLGFVVYFIV